MPFLAAIPAVVYAGIAVVGTAVSVAGSLIGASQQAQAANAQAAAMEANARNQQQIANYNAQMQRQNTEVQLQMAQAQAAASQNLATFNASVAANNANLAAFQGMGARQQYEQGLLNAKQKEIENDAVRARGREEQNRKRQENSLRIAQIRSKYGASGVAFEGSPLEVLSEAAQVGEVTVQDIAYATELESRKTFREAELTKWQAGFSLIDEYGFKVQAENYKNQVMRHEYEANLAGYDSAIAGVRSRIGMNEARLTELAGTAKYNAGMFEAANTRFLGQASLISGTIGAIGSGISGIGGAMGGMGSLGAFAPKAAGAASAGKFTSSFGGAKTGYYG